MTERYSFVDRHKRTANVRETRHFRRMWSRDRRFPNFEWHSEEPSDEVVVCMGLTERCFDIAVKDQYLLSTVISDYSCSLRKAAQFATHSLA